MKIRSRILRAILPLVVWTFAVAAFGAPSVPAEPKSDATGSVAPIEESDADELQSESVEEPDGQESAESAEEDPAVMAGKVAGEIATSVEENSADDLLNLATEVKLSAESVLDLTKVIAYCIEAEKKGLSEESLEYCRQLKVSSQLERGLTMANMFMSDRLSVRDLPRGWETVRSMALDDLSAAVEAVPDLMLAQLALGRLEMLPGGDTERAKTALDKAIELAAEEEPQALSEALKYRSILADDSQEGLNYLHRAMENVQDNPVILSLMAQRLSEIHRDDEALAAIDRALELNPENGDFKKAKAFALAALERFDEAEVLFDEALPDGPDDLLSKIEKGQFLSSIHKNEEAIALFTELIDSVKTVPTLYYLRGALYAQEKDYKKALRDVNQSLRLDPTFSEAIQLKAVIYLQQKKNADAVRLFETLLDKSPKDESNVTQLAYAMAQNDDYAGAIRTLDALQEEKPDSVSLLRSHADIDLLYGKFAEAIASYERILELSPDDSAALNNYSWLLSTAPDDAVRNGQKALELALSACEKTNYKEAHILSTLGAAYAELGDFETAKKWSAQAVAIAEKEKHDRLEDLKKEFESYENAQPWRETPEKAGVSTETTPADDSTGQEPDFF